MRKGQGISINVVVIAAIALLVLVILSVLVLRSARPLNNDQLCRSTNTAESCELAADGCPAGKFNLPQKVCLGGDQKPDADRICCA